MLKSIGYMSTPTLIACYLALINHHRPVIFASSFSPLSLSGSPSLFLFQAENSSVYKSFPQRTTGTHLQDSCSIIVFLIPGTLFFSLLFFGTMYTSWTRRQKYSTCLQEFRYPTFNWKLVVGNPMRKIIWLCIGYITLPRIFWLSGTIFRQNNVITYVNAVYTWGDHHRN